MPIRFSKPTAMSTDRRFIEHADHISKSELKSEIYHSLLESQLINK